MSVNPPTNIEPLNRRLALWVIALIVGCLLSTWLVRGFFMHPLGEMHASHEANSYVYRLIEFHDALAAGYITPQWCTHFRGGLGSPFFSYYQPGFFYVASLFYVGLDPVRALGAALWCFALLGFLSTYWLIARCFGSISGLVAGSLLLLSSYANTELYVRGDLSEFAAMMTVPLFAVCLISWLEDGGAWLLATISLAFASVTSLHPCIALPTLILSLSIIAGYSIATRKWKLGTLAAVATFLGGTLAAFYWMPIAREWNLVQADRAFGDYYHYSRHFINPLWLIGPYTRQTSIPFTFGLLLPVLALANVAGLSMRWKTISPAQRRLTITLILCLIVCVFMMTRLSAPIWSVVTPLQKLQFPWRLLTLATFALAGLCGPLLLMLDQRWRMVAAGGIIAIAWWWSIPYSYSYPAINYRHVASAVELTEQFISPDLRDEWLPRGATSKFSGSIPRVPSASTGIAVNNYRLETGQFSCDLQAEADGSVTLPHYQFPGWQITLSGREVPIKANDQGLMMIDVSRSMTGTLEGRFSATPAKRLGWFVSLVSVVAIAALTIGIHFRRRQSASADQARP